MFLGGFNPLFLENQNADLCSERKMPSETPGAILFAQKKSKCVIYSFKVQFMQKFIPPLIMPLTGGLD